MHAVILMCNIFSSIPERRGKESVLYKKLGFYLRPNPEENRVDEAPVQMNTRLERMATRSESARQSILLLVN